MTIRDLADGIVGEYDAQDRLVGLEILDAGARFGDPSTLRQASPAYRAPSEAGDDGISDAAPDGST